MESLLHLARIAFWGSVIAFPACLLLSAWAWARLDRYDGRGRP